MAVYDFSNLETKFQGIVDQMNYTFDSHEFLLVLAKQNQAEYVDALYSYKASGSDTPFKAVHGAIMQKLVKHTELVILLRDDKPSVNIWGVSSPCGEWKKAR